ncbi:MAG: hypothetical protein CM1200mP14_23440 [Gammaproteobacteria bacterium]|nr:MAG: hypothetical protein CM1200mP14_23440 [Gammaproteobacteria bacterium]
MTISGQRRRNARHQSWGRNHYSDIGIMTLAWVIEEVTQQSLDPFPFSDRLWNALGMRETMYRPEPFLRPRIAATELDRFGVRKWYGVECMMRS